MHWEEFLPLVDFVCNNKYQGTIKMAPFESLDGTTVSDAIELGVT
jgi:hypothetical protein